MYVGQVEEVADGGLEVRELLARILELARASLALAVMGVVEGECHEALPGELLGVRSGHLLFDGRERAPDLRK